MKNIKLLFFALASLSILICASCKSNEELEGCDLIDCGDHGTCNEDTDTCECDDGWTGNLCDQEIDLCADVNCENGTCNPDTGLCECNEGWMGSLCNMQVDLCADVNCANGTCNPDNGLCDCDEGWMGDNCDTEIPPDPIANFQFEISQDNWTEISFNNISENAIQYSWDFGDGISSAEENPVHIYTASGDYIVVLIATNSIGIADTTTESLSITDPNPQLTLLAGSSSKTWYLQREGIAIGIGPFPLDNNWWSLGAVTPLSERPCILDDAYTFHSDGTFEFSSNGTLFVDNEVNGGWIINGADQEGCYDEAENGVWGNNPDREDFGDGGDYTYDYDNSNNSLVLNGSGAFIGLCNKTSEGDNPNPIQIKEYAVNSVVAGEIADSLRLSIVAADYAWNFYLVSYHNEADLPEIP